AVRRADRLVPVAEQRIIELVLLFEDPMAVMTVRADPEHLRAPLLEVSHRIAHRAELALAHVREVPDVERQDDRASAEFLREVGGTNGEVCARRRLHAHDGLPKRPAGHILQLHSDRLLALSPRVPHPRGPAEARCGGPADPSAIRSPESRGIPRPRVWTR